MGAAAFSAKAAAKETGESWSTTIVQRRQQERMTHIDAWQQHVWRKDDGAMQLKTAKDFAEELRVGVDTIYTDVWEMRNIHHIPIVYDTKRHGYRYTEEVVSSPFLQLCESEMLALCLAEQFIAGIPNMPVLPDLQSARRWQWQKEVRAGFGCGAGF